MLSGYNVSSTAYPGTPNATAGKYTGISGTSYTINGPLTSGTTYCARITGVSAGSVEGLGSTPLYAAAAAAYDYFGTDMEGWALTASPTSYPITGVRSTDTSHDGTYSYKITMGYDTDDDVTTEGLLYKTTTTGTGNISFWVKAMQVDSSVSMLINGITDIATWNISPGSWVQLNSSNLNSGSTLLTSGSKTITLDFASPTPGDIIYVDTIHVP